MTDIFFDSLDSFSSDGAFLLEARTANSDFEPFNGGFTLELLGSHGTKALWSEEVAGSIDWLYVDNHGYSAIDYFDHDTATLELRDPAGRALFELSVHHGEEQSEPNEFKLWYPSEDMWCSTGMLGWYNHAFPCFAHSEGKHYFSLLMPFGQELLVDLSQKTVLPEPEESLRELVEAARKAEMLARLGQALEPSRPPRVTGAEVTNVFGDPIYPHRVDHVSSAVWAAGLQVCPESLTLVERLMEQDHKVLKPTTSSRVHFCTELKAEWSPAAMEAKTGLAILGRWTDFQPYLIQVFEVREVDTESFEPSPDWGYTLPDAPVEEPRLLKVAFEERGTFLRESKPVVPMKEFFLKVGPPDLFRQSWEEDRIYFIYFIGIGDDLSAVALTGHLRDVEQDSRSERMISLNREQCLKLLLAEPDGELVRVKLES